MAKKTPKKKTAKKSVKTATAAAGAAEVQAFKDAVQNLAVTGRAVAKAARANPELQKKSGLRSAVEKMQDVAEQLASSIPLDPPPTTLFK